MKNSKLISVSLIILIAVLGGGIAPFGKIALKEIAPFSFTLLRFIFAFIFLLPLFIKEKPKIDKETYKIVLLSLFAVLNVVLFSFGVKLTTANISQVLYGMVPLLSVVLSYFFLKTKFPLIKLFGIIIGFFGVAVIVLVPLISKGVDMTNGLIGNLLILTATISYSFYSVLSKKIQQQYTPVQITIFFVMTTIIFSVIFSLPDFFKNPLWWRSVSLIAYLSVVYVGVCGTALYYLLIQIVIKKTNPVIASLTLYLQPIAAIFWSYFLINEKVTPVFLFGTAMIFAGVWITTNLKRYK